VLKEFLGKKCNYVKIINMDMKNAMQRLETQHMKFLKKLVRVSIGDCSGNYVIRKPLGEMDIVKVTEKYSVQWGNYMEKLDGKKSNPCTGLDRSRGFQEFETPRFQHKQHMKVVRLSALCIGRLYLQKIFLVLILLEAEMTQGHSAAGRIKSMKNSTDTIGN
jgi:hypothetical protein